MEGELKAVIQDEIIEGLSAQVPLLTRRSRMPSFFRFSPWSDGGANAALLFLCFLGSFGRFQ